MGVERGIDGGRKRKNWGNKGKRKGLIEGRERKGNCINGTNENRRGRCEESEKKGGTDGQRYLKISKERSEDEKRRQKRCEAGEKKR